DLPETQGEPLLATHEEVLKMQQAFGYTFEDLRVFLKPMVQALRDPIGSMGNDAALAALSDKTQLLFGYFKQHFAQVTNPPLDPLREELITSAETKIGPEQNLLEPEPASCRQITLDRPILKNAELEKLRGVDLYGHHAITLPIFFDKSAGEEGLEKAMEALCLKVDEAILQGNNLVILSDRGVDESKVPIPSLLAVAGVHHHLVRNETRTRVGLVIESGEPREVHHFCLLLGYGAQAINPYMAFESLNDMVREGLLDEYTYEDSEERYVYGAIKGVIKVMAKMGVATIKSYRGAQLFEAMGLDQKVIDKYFTWTITQVSGMSIEGIARESLERHARAFPKVETNSTTLDVGGHYQWRKEGEHHLFNPKSIHLLQRSVRNDDYECYKQYAELINDQSKRIATLRSLLDFKVSHSQGAVPIDEVEPVEAITRRFKSGAMSYGSISKEAHEALAVAMNRIGGRSNTGEGGEDPARFTPEPNGDSKNSAIKQVASGRFGVTSHYLTQAEEIQIKMAQGAKPGEGGELPGKKVYPWIAKVRHSTAGVELISPPPHHDIYSIEDLAQLIHDLKNANDGARINVKLVSEVGVGTVAAGVAKAKADVILVSGHDGGTGASPQTSIKHAGLPWELGLAETHQTLLINNLRSRVVVETDGQLKTGRDVVIAALLGAEEFGFATTGLVAMGCIMMRVCHLDTCPVGVATQNPELRKKFMGSPDHVVNFLRFVAQDMREIMAQLGFRTVEEMIGRTDRLQPKAAIDHWKGKGIDLEPILYQPDVARDVGRYCTEIQDHGLAGSLDQTTLMKLCSPALENGDKVEATLPISNLNRVVGTQVGSEITRRFGPDGLPDSTIQLKFQGAAGQSFGAFTPLGMTMEVEGDANDYFGKGLSGARLIAYPPAESTFVPRENIIIGNVAFYGATAGEAYICGKAGERFCVRNSGIRAVVEAVGDHGCEYMTGGRVVVLGPTGRNFAAGMSGGVAYVLDESGDFANNCNAEMVDLG
ncbi:MAG: glutamate synthase large subunit, partial [Gammaproteobacteria bacterium]|nr:glutamate synthase large subunit [Gammaproteobacteria bacterium]